MKKHSRLLGLFNYLSRPPILVQQQMILELTVTTGDKHPHIKHTDFVNVTNVLHSRQVTLTFDQNRDLLPHKNNHPLMKAANEINLRLLNQMPHDI